MKNIRLILVLALFIPFVSCTDELKFGDSFLEKAPGITVNIDSIFGNAEYSRRFLWNCYAGLYYGLPSYWTDIDGKMNQETFEDLSDCFQSYQGYGGATRYYYSGTYYAGMEDNTPHTRWGYTKEGCWETIRNCWIFLENADIIPDMEAEEKARLKAEAKIIIASRYFDMFRHLGGLPLVKKSYSTDDDMNNPRTSVMATVDFMVGLLDDAIKTPELPWKVTDMANENGRLSKGAAAGLKCKILLFAASPLFNDDEPYNTKVRPSVAASGVENPELAWWTGGKKQELWERTKEACSYFFTENQGAYALDDSYDNGYKNANGTSEMLIYTRSSYAKMYQYEAWDIWRMSFGTTENEGAFNPTLEYVDMFPMADGSPFDWNNPEHQKYPFYKGNTKTRDPRLYSSVWVNGTDCHGHSDFTVTEKGEAVGSVKRKFPNSTSSGFGLWKHIQGNRVNPDKGQFYGKCTFDWPYLRMAELYLTYAEALLECGDAAGAADQIDLVRDRVGLSSIKSTPGWASGDKEQQLKEILRERACELGMEDVRFFDMIRRKLADDFKKPLHGLYTLKDDDGNYYYKKFELPSRYWQKIGFDTKWYLTAFPPSEVNGGRGMYQNPGW